MKFIILWRHFWRTKDVTGTFQATPSVMGLGLILLHPAGGHLSPVFGVLVGCND